MTLNFFHHCLRVRTPPAEQSRPDSPVLSSSSVKLCTLGAHYLGETIGGWLPVSGSGEISPVILRKSFPTLSALSCVMCALVSKCPTGFLPPSGSRDWSTMCGSYEILHLSHPDPHTHTHTHHPPPTHSSLQRLWMDSVDALSDTWIPSAVGLFERLECFLQCNFKHIKCFHCA